MHPDSCDTGQAGDPNAAEEEKQACDCAASDQKPEALLLWGGDTIWLLGQCVQQHALLEDLLDVWKNILRRRKWNWSSRTGGSMHPRYINTHDAVHWQ